MAKISARDLYDNRSVIEQIKSIRDKVDGAEQSISANVEQARTYSDNASASARQAQQASQGMQAIADQAQTSASQAQQAKAEAQSYAVQASVTARETATAVVNERTAGIKDEIEQDLGDDIADAKNTAETAKDKADLAYTTANGLAGAISTAQQDATSAKTTAQSASQLATQTDGRLTLHIASAEQNYATKGDVASVVLTVNGKISKSEADQYYQEKGDYLTEDEADEKYQPKGDYGASVWGQITGNVEDQTDMVQKMQALDSGVESRSETYADEAVGALEAEMYEELARKQNVGDYATKSELSDGLAGKQDSGDYALMSDIPDVSNFVTKSEIAGVYTYRGTVSVKSQLPTEDQVIGDVYNVASTGMNYAWDGSDWDALGASVDLSEYQKKLTPGTGISIEDDVISVTSTAPVKLKGVINTSNVSWSKGTFGGIEAYYGTYYLNNLGNEWLNLGTDVTVYASVSEDTFFEGIKAGFMGLHGWTGTNTVLLSAYTNNRDYKVNIVVEKSTS